MLCKSAQLPCGGVHNTCALAPVPAAVQRKGGRGLVKKWVSTCAKAALRRHLPVHVVAECAVERACRANINSSMYTDMQTASSHRSNWRRVWSLSSYRRSCTTSCQIERHRQQRAAYLPPPGAEEREWARFRRRLSPEKASVIIRRRVTGQLWGGSGGL